MRNRPGIAACLFAITVSIVTLLLPLTNADHSGVPDSELARVFGAHSASGPGCVQFFEDWENVSRDCWSPYWVTDNDCDWKMCAGNTDADACGEGTQWSGLNEASWIPTGELGNTGFRAKSSPCSGIIDCKEGPPKFFMSCSAGNLFGHFDDPGARVAGTGCYTPNASQGAPTGCRACSAGVPKPFHTGNVNWTWYETIECPTPIDDPIDGP